MTPDEARYFASQEAQVQMVADMNGPESNAAQALASLARIRSQGREAIIFQHKNTWVVFPLIRDDNPGCA